MSLFLVTCLCDEGICDQSFRVVEAPSRIAVAEFIRREPYSWADFLRRSRLWEDVRDRHWSSEELLKQIDATLVDGDSGYQMAIREITRVEVSQVADSEEEGGDGRPSESQMSYSAFTIQEILSRFGLVMAESADLFASAPEVVPSPRLTDYLAESLQLAHAVSTEKARSEWIIAPIPLEVRSRLDHKVALFSGVEFDVDPERGLCGFCDYLISGAPGQLFLSAPLVAVVEAKKEDLIRGIPQCVAEMVAARLFHERDGNPVPLVYGAVTTGTIWRFLQSDGRTVAIDGAEYYVGTQLPKILGIFLSMFAPRGEEAQHHGRPAA